MVSNAPVQPRKSWVRPGQVTHSFFISDIWTRYIKTFVFLPLLFILLRDRAFPQQAVDSTNSVFQKLSFLWPALESQRDAIQTTLGADQASWFEAYLLVLFLSLLLPLGRMFVEISRRAQDVMRVQATDAVMLIIFLLCDPYVLFADTPRRTLIYDFIPDHWGIFYLRQSVAFAVIAWTLLCITFYALRLSSTIWHAVFRVEMKNKGNGGERNG